MLLRYLQSHVISEAQIFHLEELVVTNIEDVDVVFNIETSSSSSSSKDLTSTRHNHQPLLLPYLKKLRVRNFQRMSHVWKCNWKKLVIPHQNQSQSSFHNLTTISISECKSIKYLFSPRMAQLLPNLKKITMDTCDGIAEVVSNRYDLEDDELATSISAHTNTVSFPHLDKLLLWYLPRLKSIDGGNAWGRSRSSAITSDTTITTTSIHDQFKSSQIGVASWFLSQHPKEIQVYDCQALSNVFPSYVVGQLHKLEKLSIEDCKSVVEVFESIERVNNDGDESDDTCTTVTVPRLANMTLCELPNLTILHITKCEVLEYIFTSSTLGSLKHLKELSVEYCKAMQVIVKEDGEHTQISKSIIVFPRLKSLKLGNLPVLKGFFLGMNEFRWPLLEEVEMYGCPEMMVFTSGHSMAPKLNYIHTGLGKHGLECGLNFHLDKSTNKTQFLMCSTPDMITLLQFPWTFSNLIEVDVKMGHLYNGKLLKSRIIFPCNELHNLKNIEKLFFTNEFFQSIIEEVFEVVERRNGDDVNSETQSSVVVFEKLKEVSLNRLFELTHLWKSNPVMVLKFPNLTKVSINRCPLLGHVFTGCMVGSLSQLQELQVSDCKNMKVIVEDVAASFETSAAEVVIELPCLKSITLDYLPKLEGFFLGKEAFRWPSLDTLQIKRCPQITVFTSGPSNTSKLKLIDTTFGSFHGTQDPNSFIKTQQQQGWRF